MKARSACSTRWDAKARYGLSGDSVSSVMRPGINSDDDDDDDDDAGGPTAGEEWVADDDPSPCTVSRDRIGGEEVAGSGAACEPTPAGEPGISDDTATAPGGLPRRAGTGGDEAARG